MLFAQARNVQQRFGRNDLTMMSGYGACAPAADRRFGTRCESVEAFASSYQPGRGDRSSHVIRTFAYPKSVLTRLEDISRPQFRR